MRILLNVDDSKHWHPVARLVGEIARATEGHVTAVSSQWSASGRAEAFEKAREILALPDARFATVGRAGLVEDVVPDESRRGDYDLVVVGRLGSLDWITNGLVATLLVRRIPTSVLVVRGKFERLRRMLVCTAGPRHGEAVVDAALALARPAGAEVTVLHALSQIPLTYEGETEVRTVEEHFLDLDLPEAKHLVEVRERLQREGIAGGVKVRTGPVVEETLREVKDTDADLVALGAHETEPGTEGFLYEDVAGILVRAMPVSFLVVRRAPRLSPDRRNNKP